MNFAKASTMRPLLRMSVWHWTWKTHHSWLRDFFPLIALTASCLAVGCFCGANNHPATGPTIANATGSFAWPASLALFVFRTTGNVMLAVMLVVLILAAAAYWLRQKIRLAYGVLELCIGILVAGLAVARMAAHSVSPALTAEMWNEDLFRLATGVYFVVRGMTNTRDGIEFRPRRYPVTTAGVVQLHEPEPSSPELIPAR